jgi:uncharacterized membrane protein
MPAVIIRMLDSLSAVAFSTVTPEQRDVLLRQAEMILHSAERSVSEPHDLEEIRTRHRRMVFVARGTEETGNSPNDLR